jgi:hypothetical protein
VRASEDFLKLGDAVATGEEGNKLASFALSALGREIVVVNAKVSAESA